MSRNNGASWVTAASSTGHAFAGLTNGTEYQFQVWAVNAGSNGTPTDSVAATPGVNFQAITPSSLGTGQLNAVTFGPNGSTNQWRIVGNNNLIASQNEGTAGWGTSVLSFTDNGMKGCVNRYGITIYATIDNIKCKRQNTRRGRVDMGLYRKRHH